MKPSTSQRLQSALEHAPRQAGVYLMRDSQGTAIYVGKAKDLKARVRSYLAGGDGRVQLDALLERVQDIEFLVTGSEKDALLLENNLIKQLGPRFNIRLRDDKSYVILKINVQHRWPRAVVTRGHRADGSIYLGPYSSADELRRTMRSLARAFPLRLCSDHTLDNRTRPCVYYDIGMCSAPCVGRVSEDAYQDFVAGLVRFMKGRDTSLLATMRRRMAAAAEGRRFEQAAVIRDQIAAIERTVERQHTEETGATYDRDVFGYAWDGDRLAIHVLYYRDGKMINSGNHRYRALLPVSELLGSFLVQFYDGETPIPPEILLPVPVVDAASLATWLSDRAQHSVKVRTPERGEKRRQVELANANAAQLLAAAAEERQSNAALLDTLQDKLGLHNFPERIECYDVSHLAGGQTVGSRVAFAGAAPDKANYRRYRIATPTGGDDFAALEEVLERRLSRGLTEDDLPDLIVVDGGAGQLARIEQVFERLNVVGIDLIGLAKARRQKRAGLWVATDERVFRPGVAGPLTLPQDSPENYLLVRIRDEAHRFAIQYHRHRRRRETLRSSLDLIPGIGPKRKKRLIQHFGSPRAVSEATLEELEAVPGIGPQAARTVQAFFAARRPAPSPEAKA